jgi:hypothetical protein
MFLTGIRLAVECQFQEGDAVAKGMVSGRLALASALLAACSAAPGPASPPGVPPLAGQVVMADLYPEAAADRNVSATMAEVATAATVSLIDANSSETVATTKTTANGAFIMVFASDFLPKIDPYYLEAVKGLASNRAGNSAARVRTIVAFRGGWVSAHSDALAISRASTAVSLIVSHRTGTAAPVTVLSLLGSIGTGGAPPPFAEKDSGITQPEYGNVYNHVGKVLLADGDPFGLITYDPILKSYSANLPNVPRVFQMSPTAFGAKDVVTLTGQNFNSTPNLNVVSFAGVAGTVLSSSGAQLTVRVPDALSAGSLIVSTPVGDSNSIPYKVLKPLGGSVSP